jgi:hypothetical protein
MAGDTRMTRKLNFDQELKEMTNGTYSIKSACLPAKLRTAGFPLGLLRQYPRAFSSSLSTRNSVDRVDIFRISFRNRTSFNQTSLGIKTLYAALTCSLKKNYKLIALNFAGVFS